MNKLQRGFTLLEVLLVILILVVVGFGGYYVWNKHNTPKKPAATTASQKASSTASSTTAPASAQQYLTIKEWGVRMKVTSGTDSLYYYIPSDNPNFAYLSFKTMSDISPDCAPDKTSLAAIGRLTPAEQQNATSNPNDGNPPGSVKIGNYYYSYSHAQAACYDESSSAAITKAQPDTDVSKIFDTLEAVPSQ